MRFAHSLPRFGKYCVFAAVILVVATLFGGRFLAPNLIPLISRLAFLLFAFGCITWIAGVLFKEYWEARGTNAAPRLLLLGAFILLYLLSLFLPGLVYQADTRDNPKYNECVGIVSHPEQVCYAFGFGDPAIHDDCRPLAANKDPESIPGTVNKAMILKYCAGYNEPVSQSDKGYTVLLQGFLGAFIGIVAWYANLLILLALGLIRRRPRIATAIVLVALIFASQTFFLGGRIIPKDESGDNNFIISHPGIGFYLWELSLIFLFLYCVSRSVSQSSRTGQSNIQPSIVSIQNP